MTNLEKIEILFEDIYGASCFWENDDTRNHLMIFTDEILELNHISMINEAISRPIRIVADEDKTYTSAYSEPFEVSELIEGKKKSLVIHRIDDAGFIPYEYEPYLVYFQGEDLSRYPNGKEVKEIMDKYFTSRKII